MTPTSVGMRCPECAGDRTEVRTTQNLTTGRMQATYVLIGINVFVFVLQLLTGGPSGTDGRVFADGALCANAVGDGGICGGGGQVIQSTGGEWWRIISSGFLHGGLIHLGLNMFVLFILGQVLEPAIGTVRFVAVYLVALIAGAVGALLDVGPGHVHGRRLRRDLRPVHRDDRDRPTARPDAGRPAAGVLARPQPRVHVRRLRTSASAGTSAASSAARSAP